MKTELTKNLEKTVQEYMAEYGDATVEGAMNSCLERLEMMREYQPLLSKTEVAFQEMAKTEDLYTRACWLLMMNREGL
jgi:hypothetical protein